MQSEVTRRRKKLLFFGGSSLNHHDFTGRGGAALFYGKHKRYLIQVRVLCGESVKEHVRGRQRRYCAALWQAQTLPHPSASLCVGGASVKEHIQRGAEAEVRCSTASTCATSSKCVFWGVGGEEERRRCEGARSWGGRGGTALFYGKHINEYLLLHPAQLLTLMHRCPTEPLWRSAKARSSHGQCVTFGM